MTKVFNGRAATEEYMSTHSLTFSTPEMTLRKFALWLGEHVNRPGTGPSGEAVPRLMLYVEEKATRGQSDLMPVVDDSFKPSGAVADMYKDFGQQAGGQDKSPPRLVPLDRETLEPEERFCISCGSKIKASTRFCTKCGSAQS